MAEYEATRQRKVTTMHSLQVFERPRLSMRNLSWCDDTNTPYVTTRRAFRLCGAGVLRLHAAETFSSRQGRVARIGTASQEGRERVWFYRDEKVCRRIYGEWAGHGDPDGFDFSWEVYAIP